MRSFTQNDANAKSAAALSRLGGLNCCVPGTARILKGALSLSYVSKLIKSQTQPDGGEGYSGMATGYPATVPGKEAALPRQGTANARGDEQEPS